MEAEKQILIEYLSQNGFSKENAALYVNSLSKNPQDPTDFKFSSILKLIEFAIKKNNSLFVPGSERYQFNPERF